MSAWMRLRRTLDRLTIYLPLILFGLLALGSWWLVRSMPELLPPGTDKLLRVEPDYRLEKFTVKSFDLSGRMTREISGQSATHFPAKQELHIQNIRIFAENELGARLQAQARLGVSKEPEQRVELSGDVLAVRAADKKGPRVTLKGEAVTALMDEERLVSSVPVEIVRGGDVFTSENMDFDIRNGHYELQGRVKSVLSPDRKP
ncbi:LPS export ABC transporter periplasmic protein LptC [Limnohabitans sp. Rim28]|uniref:LPS export ABC transporter periplasmic protein LptC n=1 Tax=Limnohabitans sp. Rim28 TaxID=1100720 RepID=UPI0003682BB0|nr:LPS export ABC transporter periplasmic protein LptC [Limnohabitans sp. Rim28]PVE07350.1 LPS export ABC transporter periplasmic protein LptC [Limnohabitans sp. Rim28]